MNLKLRASFLAAAAVLILMASVPAPAQAPPSAPVVVGKVEEKTVRVPVKLVGAVEPARRSLVASEVEGVVESFPAQEGSYVPEGEVLVEFNKRTIEIALSEAKAAYKEAEARYDMARKNLARFDALAEKGVASVQNLQDAQTEKEAWAARVGQLRAQIEASEYNLEKSSIRAPFGGYITEEHTEVGEWVVKGGPVVEMIDTESVEISLDMPERYVSKVDKNQKVQVSFDALPDTALEGEITSLVPQADREARTFPLKVTVRNEAGLVKSGMVARVSFPVGEPSTVKLVPKDAIVTQNNAHMIYIVSNGTAQPLPVTTGTAYDGMIEVTGAVEPGMSVVIRGNERLMPGQQVEVVSGDGKKPGSPD